MRTAAAAAWLACASFAGAGAGATPPSPATVRAQAAAAAALPRETGEDAAFADRGFVATRAEPQIKAADGRLIWDLNAYAFLRDQRPQTVNPSLWRQAGLLSRHGLFQVAEGVWQVRGFDIANVTFIKGATGWVVIDPLTSAETAAAALALVNEKLGARPVTGLIYTHSHADHYGGARGVLDPGTPEGAKVPVIAPEGFLEHAVSENVIAGVAMGRRALFQFGVPLAKGADGQVSSGIGQALSAGTQTLIPPTVLIERTGETLTVDGVQLEFQMTPGTEAPAEMNIYLPAQRLLCLAENANATMHNVLTPRGALVRDAKVWADGLTESLRLYGGRTDAVFTSHGWPRFGRDTVAAYLARHRDAYKFLHDQTVRLMNQGLTGEEIAERLELPPALAGEWYNRGYYGTMRFNSRAVYQRYLGFYDGDPAHLAPYPPAEESRLYVEALGGAEKVRGLVKAAFDAGDYRWAAELGRRGVMAGDAAAREGLAAAYDQLGFQAESAIWRNMYLSAAKELRDGVTPRPGGGVGAALDTVRAMPTPLLLDLLAVRLDADRAGDTAVSLALVFPERNERFRLAVKNRVLTWAPEAEAAASGMGAAEATVTTPRAAFIALALTDAAPPQARAAVASTGDAAAFDRLLGWLDKPKGDFPLVWREAAAPGAAPPR